MRRPRLADRARRRRRQDRLEGIQHRTRRGRADRAGVQAVLRHGPGQGPRRHDLAAGRLEDRRRHRVGLDLLRSRAGPDLLRDSAIPGPWNAEQRPGDNKWTSGDLRARPRYRRGALGSTSSRRTTSSTTTASTRTCCSTCRSAGSAQGARPSRAQRLRLRDRPRRRASALGRRRSARQRVDRASTSKTGRPIAEPGQAPARRQGRARHLPRRARRQGLEPRPRIRRAPGCSTSRTTTCAWTSSRWRRTTSPARPTSAPRCGMYAGPGGHRGRVHARGTRSARKEVWKHQGATCPSGAARSPPQATSSSTARWTAGSRRWTRAPANCYGSSRPAPESSASRSAIAGPTARQYVAVLAGVGGWAGAVVSTTSTRATRRPPGLCQRHGRPQAETTQGGHPLCLCACPAAPVAGAACWIAAAWLSRLSPGRVRTREARVSARARQHIEL